MGEGLVCGMISPGPQPVSEALLVAVSVLALAIIVAGIVLGLLLRER